VPQLQQEQTALLLHCLHNWLPRLNLQTPQQLKFVMFEKSGSRVNFK
jgi:hypothetical protein